MGSSERAAREVASRGSVWELAERQHGVVSRRQLLGLGFSARAIEHRLARGRLHRAGRGVYAVGRSELTQRGRWMAAILACGSDALLSHGSAAALWGIGREYRGIEISLRLASPKRLSGLRVYRRPTLADRDAVEWKGVPVTSITQTIVDLAARLGRGATERLVNEADRLDLINPPTLRRELEAHRCEPGVKPLRFLLDRRTFRLTRSDLEGLFLPIAAEVGLPVPLTKQWLNGFEVDFYWPDLGFVVETDGLRYHRTPAEQARDRLRDQTHTAAGFVNLRFTHEQVNYDPAHVAKMMRAAKRLLPAPVVAGLLPHKLSGDDRAAESRPHPRGRASRRVPE